MITITGINGQKHHLSAAAIASVTEASTSSQWHGIRAIVKLFDKSVIEAQEPAQQIAAAVEGES